MSKFNSLNLSNFDTSLVTSMNSMFNNCNELTFIAFSKFKTKSLTDMGKMFRSCSVLENIDFSNFDTSEVTNCDNLFYGCTALISINLTNFNSSSIIDANSMFNNCRNLKGLDLSNFDMSNVELAQSMFSDCQNLELIIFNNKYITEKINTTYRMFNNCKKLTSIDLSFIDTSKVSNMDRMFYNCIQLQILNIPNFNTISVESMTEMFSGCENLEFLNAYSLVDNVNLDNEFNELPENLNFCVNENAENIVNILETKNGINDCFYVCKSLNQKFVIYDTNKCFSNCIHDKNYLFEYSNKCFISCPVSTKHSDDYYYLCLEITEDTIILTENKEETSISIYTSIPKEFKGETTIPVDISSILKENEEEITIPFINSENNIFSSKLEENKDHYDYDTIIKETNTIIKETNILINEINYNLISDNCNIKDFLNQKCETNYNSITSVKDIIENIKYNIVNKNMKPLLENIINNEKKEYTIDNGNTIYQITSSYNQNTKNYNNISSIKLGDCENILKEKNKLNTNDTLIIFKVDYYEEGLLIPIIEYEVYHPLTFEKLNLDICENEKIEILMPININEDEIYKHDPNSDYYNDKCFPTDSKNGFDIILSDRKNEFINKNLTLCENNCEYEKYDSEIKKVVCKCEIKKEINIIGGYIIDKDKFFGKFIDFKNMINLYILKCYKLLLIKDGLITNIGNYILLSTIIFFIISVFIFIGKG